MQDVDVGVDRVVDVGVEHLHCDRHSLLRPSLDPSLVHLAYATRSQHGSGLDLERLLPVRPVHAGEAGASVRVRMRSGVVLEHAKCCTELAPEHVRPAARPLKQLRDRGSRALHGPHCPLEPRLVSSGGRLGERVGEGERCTEESEVKSSADHAERLRRAAGRSAEEGGVGAERSQGRFPHHHIPGEAPDQGHGFGHGLLSSIARGSRGDGEEGGGQGAEEEERKRGGSESRAR